MLGNILVIGVCIIFYLLFKTLMVSAYLEEHYKAKFSFPLGGKYYRIYEVTSKESLLMHILLYTPLFEIFWLVYLIMWCIFSILKWLIVGLVPCLIKLGKEWANLPDTEEDTKQ